MTAQRALMVFVLLLILLSAFSGCIAPPKGNPAKTTPASGSSKGGTAATPIQTTVPAVTGFVTSATPFPVATTRNPPTNYTVLPERTVNAIPFTAIYYNNIPFKQNTTAISYNLTMPPLVIEMCFKPNMTTRTIWYESRTGDDKGVTEKVTTISPAAWFDVKVRDPVTGNVVAEDGYARTYSVDTAKKLTIRSAGSYLVEFSGNDLSAEIQITVPGTTEQKGAAVRNLSCSVLLLK
jgi:hypothetical protein